MDFEHYFLDKFNEPSETDGYIFEIADKIRKAEGLISFEELRGEVPITKSLLERRFKRIIGVNISKYIKICRFDKAKTFLMLEDYTSLTHVAIDSGYYDQSHFSNEFKKPK